MSAGRAVSEANCRRADVCILEYRFYIRSGGQREILTWFGHLKMRSS